MSGYGALFLIIAAGAAWSVVLWQVVRDWRRR